MQSFERNLEVVQKELNIERANHVPVFYKNEFEMASLMGYIPLLVVTYIILTILRKPGGIMKRNQKGGGLFGSFMDSTAKLINSNEIGVGFK